MTTTFTDSAGTVYTPAIVTVLSSKYSPTTVVHKVLNPSASGTVITNIGPGALSGSITVVFDSEPAAHAFAQASVLGVEFTDADTMLSGNVIVPTGDISIELDDTTRAAWTVAFDWGLLT